MKTETKCSECNEKLIMVTGWGALTNQNIDKWPLLCAKCELVFDQKLNILKKKTELFQNMMKNKKRPKEAD